MNTVFSYWFVFVGEKLQDLNSSNEADQFSLQQLLDGTDNQEVASKQFPPQKVVNKSKSTATKKPSPLQSAQTNANAASKAAPQKGM